MTTTTPTSPLVDKPSLLIRLVADVLAQCASYQMSDECVALLRKDAELLAALQRLAFVAIQKGGVKR